MGIDMAGGVMPPQTPGGLGGKVPALDMAKVVGSGALTIQPPQSTTNKASDRLLLQSPAAGQARNALMDRAFGNTKEKQGDVVNKRELPNSEFQDFLMTYDESMWQRPEED